MPLLRSLLFYLGLIVSTIIATPVCLLIYPVPFKLRFRIASRWAAFNLWWLKVTCGLGYTVSGQKNIPAGPAIVMCKHQSAWETLALQLVFPPQAWILKRELLWIPVYGWGLAAMQPIAIDRSSAIKSFHRIVEEGCKRLARGIWVVIYPEGTRVSPGARKKYLPGGGMLAEKSGFPVVPVAHNSGYFWPRDSLIKHPGIVSMVIGPAIETAGKTATEITTEAENWIEGAIARLPSPAAGL